MNSKQLNLTMLYVEDDPDTREVLAEIFAYKVETLYVAKDGVEALEIFKKHRIHFIISDYQMPNMDGNELCKEVKKINPLVCFILLTAYNDTSLLINAIESGVDKFLQKPVNADKLFTIMDSVYEKIMDKFRLEYSTVCLQEAEKVALISYWDVDLDTKKIHFSKEALELFGVSPQREGNASYLELAKRVKQEDKAKFIEIFESLVFEIGRVDTVIAIKNCNSKYTYIHIIAKRWKSSACGNEHVVGIFQDVSYYEHQKISLIKESQLDPMLKIANKKLIGSSLKSLMKLSKRYGHAIGVIFFDIDDFKSINSTAGHLVADKLLIEFSALIKNNIRQSDVFGRWGGDEFIIITGYSSPEATIDLAKKIRTKVSKCQWQSDIILTVSMGLSFYKLGDDVNSLIQRADMNMLEAKKDGKNRYNY